MKRIVILLFLCQMKFSNLEPVPSKLWDQKILPDDLDKNKFYLREGDIIAEKVFNIFCVVTNYIFYLNYSRCMKTDSLNL